jgi:hypothetical protein
MNRRSALTLAAGLTFALLIGVAAISLTLGGVSDAHAQRKTHPAIVKHRVHTVRIHRTSKGSTGGGVQIVHLAPTPGPSSTAATASENSEDPYESDGGEDDGSTSASGLEHHGDD